MCWVHFEGKGSWREDRKKREREEIKGWCGTDRGTAKQRKPRKKRGIQVSVVDYACWAGHFDPPLVLRERETLGEKGQLSDRWIERETESLGEEQQSENMIICNWLS